MSGRTRWHGRVYEDDLKFARRLIDGDAQSFRLLIEGHAQRLAAFVMRRVGAGRANAEDIVQETLIRAIRAMPQYRGEASLHTWLCRICRSVMADQHRKAARLPQTVSLDTHEHIAAIVAGKIAANDPLDLAGNSDSEAAVLRALARIPPRYAHVLELKYGDDLSVEEISASLGVTTVAAQSLLARARDAFREAWKVAVEEAGPEGHGLPGGDWRE